MRTFLVQWVLPLVIAGGLFAGLLYFVLPTAARDDQRAEAIELADRRAELTAEQQELRAAIGRMRTPDEIERIARRDFGLVYPGEESYALLPAPPESVSIPSSWPFSMLHGEVID